MAELRKASGAAAGEVVGVEEAAGAVEAEGKVEADGTVAPGGARRIGGVRAGTHSGGRAWRNKNKKWLCLGLIGRVGRIYPTELGCVENVYSGYMYLQRQRGLRGLVYNYRVSDRMAFFGRSFYLHSFSKVFYLVTIHKSFHHNNTFVVSVSQLVEVQVVWYGSISPVNGDRSKRLFTPEQVSAGSRAGRMVIPLLLAPVTLSVPPLVHGFLR